MRRRRWLVLAFLVSAPVVWWLAQPSWEERLAAFELPDAPVLSPEEERATFRLPPGFRAELVAAEPLVVDPVAIDWDDAGRLYVVEMRGYMPDIDGTGEERPVGRVVVLEDTDADGRMDRSDVFLDGLVMPRAVAVLPEGVLVGVPPDLWLCRDTDGDRRCDEKRRLSEYAVARDSPEHLENRLLPGLDGWIYNAKSRRRFRLASDGSFRVEDAVFRGQWGLDQDDAGRLYYNHNSGFLYADVFPAEYTLRQPLVAMALAKPGVNLPLAEGEEVWGVRLAVGLNRAYIPGELRRDGRQRKPTAVSGLAVQRGDQFGEAYLGDVFVPESAGSAVARFRIETEEGSLRASHERHADPDWGEREFLASTDERFRPVDARVGPDGAIWIVDMYRGVIQHAQYVSDHLRAYVARRGLEPPGATGRIWRVVAEDREVPRRPPPLATTAQQVVALDHANGWVRDRAQRRLVHAGGAEVAALVRAASPTRWQGRLQRLWTLAGLDAIDAETWREALADSRPEVRAAAVRMGESLFDRPGIDVESAVLAALEDTAFDVRLQALHTLGTWPPDRRPLAALRAAGRDLDRLVRQAALLGVAALELEVLRTELDEASGKPDAAELAWLESLAGAAHLAAQVGPDAGAGVAGLLDVAAALRDEARLGALLGGIAAAQGLPGSRRVELAAAHPLFAPERELPASAVPLAARVRTGITWPGDPRPGGARALTPEESARRERGAALYAATCATCHGESGGGIAGLAPPLVGAPWVRDADEWLVRIALHGLTGPLRVRGRLWERTMPGHGHDPRFDDATLAGLLTHLRRSWGHADEPVSPETVTRIRALTRGRARPWTADELLALPVVHRLDRYVGTWRIPIVGIEVEVERDGPVLSMGRKKGPSGPLEEVGGGFFTSPQASIQFALDETGRPESATLFANGQAVPLSRAE